MKIYVASSWRNNRQSEVVKALRAEGHEVYDFKNPEPYTGFSWSELDPNWQEWTNKEYFEALNHPRAVQAFNSDFDAMKWADVCVLIMPCGRSAHTEAGWMQGQNKPTIVLIEDKAEPELMYKIFSLITDSLEDAISYLQTYEPNTLDFLEWKEKTIEELYNLKFDHSLHDLERDFAADFERGLPPAESAQCIVEDYTEA